MIRDAIVEEVRHARRKTEEACGYDFKRLAEHYRRVKVGDGKLIRRAPKRSHRNSNGKTAD